MILSLALFAASLFSRTSLPLDQGESGSDLVQLSNPFGDAPDVMYRPGNVLDPPKEAPKAPDGKHLATFAFHTDGYAMLKPGDRSVGLRFRVFTQSFKAFSGLGPQVCTELLRLWEIDHKKLNIDHSGIINQGIVDVYLCETGEPGGEQLFDVDTEAGIRRKVNTIYIYDLASFSDPIEQAREVAHEYGHAVLPGVGHFKNPEYWANGFLGEKLFLRWLRDSYKDKKLESKDVMNASLPSLDKWVKDNVDPLVKAASQNGPNEAILQQTSSSGMGAYEGLALYMATIVPSQTFGRSMLLIGSDKATDYPQACALAAEEQGYDPEIPTYLAGSPLWLPIGSCHVTGGQVVKKTRGWVYVKQLGGPLHVVRPGE